MSDVRVRYPANTLLIGDGNAGTPGQNIPPPADPNDPHSHCATEWCDINDYTTRHSGGANYAFADGHVKWLNPASINIADVASGNNFAFRIVPATPSSP